jgi:hypothetical protein
VSKYAEQISAFEQKRAALVAANEAIMAKAAEDGSTLDAEQQEAFDGNQEDMKAIDDHLKRLRIMEKAAGETARPVEGQTERQGSAARVPAQIKAAKPAPGIQFARFARCMILGKKAGINPIDLAKQEYGERDPHVVEMVMKSLNLSTKANIPAVNTTADAALIGNEGGFADYVEFLRNQTIVGRFGQNGVPSLRRVPFYFPVVTQATGGTAYWPGEGNAKPMTKPTWTRTELTPLVVAALAASTIQALRFSSPSAEMALRDDLTAAVVEAIDTAFIDPANSGSAGAKPASITNGISGTVASSGSDAEAVRADARAAMAVFVTAKNPLTSGVWIMSGINALGIPRHDRERRHLHGPAGHRLPGCRRHDHSRQCRRHLACRRWWRERRHVHGSLAADGRQPDRHVRWLGSCGGHSGLDVPDEQRGYPRRDLHQLGASSSDRCGDHHGCDLGRARRQLRLTDTAGRGKLRPAPLCGEHHGEDDCKASADLWDAPTQGW